MNGAISVPISTTSVCDLNGKKNSHPKLEQDVKHIVGFAFASLLLRAGPASRQQNISIVTHIQEQDSNHFSTTH